MKKIVLLFPTLFLCSCNISAISSQSETSNSSVNEISNSSTKVSSNYTSTSSGSKESYGAFLGVDEFRIDTLSKYESVSLDLENITTKNITNLQNRGTKVFGYLNVGSLENYRDYYLEYEEYTFADYDEWPDERWIKVYAKDWQDFVVDELATSIKNKGAFGVYLDNVDVIDVIDEWYGLDEIEDAIASIESIISRINNLGLKVMMNGGSTYIDNNPNGLSNIYAYHQEEVFSLIEDYENNIFGKQNSDDKQYYQSIAKTMKNKGKEVYFLEYTTDSSLKKQIETYCSSNGYSYYIANSIELTY